MEGTKTKIGKILDKISDFVFFFALFTFLIIFALNFYQQKKFKEWENKINEFSQKEAQKAESEYFKLRQKLNLLNSLVSEIVFPSKFLDFFQKNILPQTKVVNLNFGAKECKAEFLAKTAQLSFVQQQVDVLSQKPEIEKVELQELKKEGDNILFKISFWCKKELIK